MNKLIALTLAALGLRLRISANNVGAWMVTLSYGPGAGYIGGRALCIGRGAKGTPPEHRLLRVKDLTVSNGLNTYVTGSETVVDMGATTKNWALQSLATRLKTAVW